MKIILINKKLKYNYRCKNMWFCNNPFLCDYFSNKKCINLLEDNKFLCNYCKGNLRSKLKKIIINEIKCNNQFKKNFFSSYYDENIGYIIYKYFICLKKKIYKYDENINIYKLIFIIQLFLNLQEKHINKNIISFLEVKKNIYYVNPIYSHLIGQYNNFCFDREYILLVQDLYLSIYNELRYNYSNEVIHILRKKFSSLQFPIYTKLDKKLTNDFIENI